MTEVVLLQLKVDQIRATLKLTTFYHSTTKDARQNTIKQTLKFAFVSCSSKFLFLKQNMSQSKIKQNKS